MFSYDKGLGISIDPATALVSSGASFITFCTKCVVTAVQGPEPETTGDAGAVWGDCCCSHFMTPRDIHDVTSCKTRILRYFRLDNLDYIAWVISDV